MFFRETSPQTTKQNKKLCPVASECSIALSCSLDIVARQSLNYKSLQGHLRIQMVGHGHKNLTNGQTGVMKRSTQQITCYLLSTKFSFKSMFSQQRLFTSFSKCPNFFSISAIVVIVLSFFGEGPGQSNFEGIPPSLT